ncbi:lysylphosphatidylglycerol synthase transmembrane domain-containing protein [Nocardioides nitrophenolicus]|uniref:lysylphosphatidylglycerol synthase transmembrane domain-containing protein n=1 Tax=Nocardioides nitrophenolicus TaxID=60489 RepID=UPI001EF93A9D|nr:lysylphosphatidylglycerol synthase transmembrane domain-containing protein [Nocardioides nitrophenolicus]
MGGHGRAGGRRAEPDRAGRRTHGGGKELTIDRRALAARIRLVAAVAILVVLAARLGARPFLDGLAHTDPRGLAVALVVTAATTACCARRWSLLTTGLGVPVPFRDAYRSCYRAQLVNATLPGGVLGDLHRGYRRGRQAGALGRGLRSVVWDRASGQVVQAGLVVAVVPLLPGAVRGWVLGVLGVLVALGVLALATAAPLRREAAAALDGVWPEVLLLSALAAGGHVLVFLVAARTVGVEVGTGPLVALALLVLLASAIPASVAGWGPREGAAAWVFGATGLGAASGVEVAVVYGVMSLVATLPGLLTLEGGPAWVSGRTSS